tara:strand:+ start:1565 stop:1912 length:348 start_codon:yes stop_codon:yes gene_type:complete
MKIHEVQERLNKFTKDRNWEQYHNPKNLTMALSVEVAELVEIFQWSNSSGLDEIKNEEIKEKIREEVADIFIYLLNICEKLDLDIPTIINDKIDKNEIKYPVSKSYGSSKKYTDL